MKQARVVSAGGKTVPEAINSVFDAYFQEKNPAEMFGGKSIFIKIDLSYPANPPVTTDLHALIAFVRKLQEWSPGKIEIGAIPEEGFKGKVVGKYLGIPDLIKPLDVQLYFLDEPNIPTKKVTIENREYTIPSSIQESDVYISFSPGKNHPLFEGQYSCLNCSKILAGTHAILPVEKEAGKDYCFNDTYRDHLVRRVGDILSLRSPDLVLIDCYRYLEGQGWMSFESNVVTPSFVILGDNAISVDATLLQLMGFDPQKNELLRVCSLRGLGETDPAKIDHSSEISQSINPVTLPILDVTEDLRKPAALEIKKGSSCSGCLLQARKLLDVLNTIWIKDIGNLGQVSFLLGENPLEPENLDSVILFGDCAKSTTANMDFRTIITTKTDKKGNEKTKIKPRKSILEIPGCPPRAFDFIQEALKFFGKKKLPNSHLFQDGLKWCYDTTEKQEKKLFAGE